MPVLPLSVTIAQARRALTAAFEQAGLDSPDLDARLLTGHALDLNHVELATGSHRPLIEAEVKLLEMLAGRRLKHEPVARILGQKEFWGLPFQLNADTLVPRPETETLVETVLSVVEATGMRSESIRIADLGTGSGALLLALLDELPNATGVGTDISDGALAMASENAHHLGLGPRTHFIKSNFGAALYGRFDVVVSNPPYIASTDIATLAPEVLYDPRRALDGGADGLDCYRIIAGQAGAILKSGALLVVELGIGQEPDVARLFRAAGLAPEPAHPDLAGVPRALPARVATITP
jgi:release factor glutamine methyltransferase